MKELEEIQKAARRLEALADPDITVGNIPISESMNLLADALEARGQVRALETYREIVGLRRRGSEAQARGRTAFGCWAQYVRNCHGIVLGDMAKVLGISPAKLSGYEVGRETVPDSTVRAIEILYKARAVV